MQPGNQQTTPLVDSGVMYLANPGLLGKGCGTRLGTHAIAGEGLG
jgi:hypothetical protein